jgi:hypothetical protein
MREKSGFFMITIFLLALLAAVGCSDGGSDGEEEEAKGRLILGFGGKAGASSKSFTPEEIAVTTISVEGAGPGGATISASSSDYAPVELELVPGSWVITAKGHNDKGLEVASGFLELSLEPSERVAKDIFLSPLAGVGSLSLSWSLVGDIGGSLSVEGSLMDSSGLALPIAATFSGPTGGPLRFENLRNGSWTLNLRLFCDGAVLCGLAEGILVAAGMETKAAVRFEPPKAALALGFVLPNYASLALAIEPKERKVALKSRIIFRAPVSGTCAWYADGLALGAGFQDAELSFLPDQSLKASSIRFDCLSNCGSGPRSGAVKASFYPELSLGILQWGEILTKASASDVAQAAMRGLGDCRDMAWSPEGELLAVVGRSSNCISIFEAGSPGAVFALASVGGSAEPRLSSPNLIRFLSKNRLLAFSDSAGKAYALSIVDGKSGEEGSKELLLESVFTDPLLAGAKDIAMTADRSSAYIASAEADCICLLSLNGKGEPVEAKVAAKAWTGELATLSKPSCLALSQDGSIIALGTMGDDAIYIFNRDLALGSLNFRQRIDKSAFPSQAPLSDPCSLAFSSDGGSLFVLSYYGKSLVRLDRDAATGIFAPVQGVKSGQGGVAGFSSPKRLSLSSDGKYLAVLGGGTGDGLSLFEVENKTTLSYCGSLLPSAGIAVPPKSTSLAFSPAGKVLALAADSAFSLFAVNNY